MQSLGWLAVALCVLQVISLPVPSEISDEDTKVMRCVVEVISDILSKPRPLPISPKCLETLRGDDRIISILRRNNLLRELQQLAAQGAFEKGQQQKKSTDFSEELSKALQQGEDKESERVKQIAPEDSASASHEVHEESNKESEKNISEEERNDMEKKEPSEQEVTSEEEEDESKGADEALERNEIGSHEEAARAENIDNHITDKINAKDLSEEKQEKPEFQTKDESHESHESHELKEEKQLKSKMHKEGAKDYSTDDHEDVQSAAERKTRAETNNKSSQEDTEDEIQRSHGRSEEVPEPEKEEKTLESDDKSHEDSEEIHSLGNAMTPEDDTAQTMESRSGEAGESSSKELEDSKRWNKMDELAKELTSKKRMAETKSKEEEEEEEDPDRSMKIHYRARKNNFDSRERDVKRSWKHHSTEDSSERALEPAIRQSPEEKKEEEGSANRRTEDQELESLSAIEAELEKVARKLIELRRG